MKKKSISLKKTIKYPKEDNLKSNKRKKTKKKLLKIQN